MIAEAVLQKYFEESMLYILFYIVYNMSNMYAQVDEVLKWMFVVILDGRF